VWEWGGQLRPHLGLEGGFWGAGTSQGCSWGVPTAPEWLPLTMGSPRWRRKKIYTIIIIIINKLLIYIIYIYKYILYIFKKKQNQDKNHSSNFPIY